MTGGPRHGYGCTVDGCPWVLPWDAADSIPMRYGLAADLPPGRALDEAIHATARARAAHLEALLAEHAEAHDERDFLRTIHRLHLELACRDPGPPGRSYRARVEEMLAILGDSPGAVGYLRVIHRLHVELAGGPTAGADLTGGEPRR